MHGLPKRKRSDQARTIESLEIRNLLTGIMSVALPPAVPEIGPNETLDEAMELGSSGVAVVEGTIDRDGIDVDWYRFPLSVASEVDLNSSSGTLGLYNDALPDTNDRLNPTGNRLLEQDISLDAAGAHISRNLA